MERTLDLFYDELVIGADLSALQFCYARKIQFIYCRKLLPYEYNLTDSYIDDNKQYEILLNKLLLFSLCPLGDKIFSIRLEDDNTLKVTTHSNMLITIKYNKLYISDDYRVEGLPEIIGKTSSDNCVIDHFTVHKRAILPDISHFNDRLIKTIFYTNKRVSMDNDRKWIVVRSLIADDDLNKFEFSDTYTRLILIRKYSPKIVKFTHKQRKIFSLGKNLYSLPENIIILTEEVKNQLSTPVRENLQMKFLEEKIWKT